VSNEIVCALEFNPHTMGLTKFTGKLFMIHKSTEVVISRILVVTSYLAVLCKA